LGSPPSRMNKGAAALYRGKERDSRVFDPRVFATNLLVRNQDSRERHRTKRVHLKRPIASNDCKIKVKRIRKGKGC